MSCKIYPEIKNKEGVYVQSELYKQLYSLTKDRETSNIVYALVHDSLTSQYFEDVEKDANGEPTIEALNQKINLKEIIGEKANLRFLTQQLTENKSFDNLSEILPKVLSFNASHSEYVASIYKTGGVYNVKVEVINDTNNLEKDKLKANTALNEFLIKQLNSIGVGVDTSLPYSTIHGVFDPTNAYTTATGLKTMIRISNDKLGQDALPEEFSHFVIEALGNEPLIKRVLNLLNTPGAVEEVLKETFDTYNKLYKGDNSKLIKEAAGKLLANFIKGEQDYLTTTNKPLLSRVWQRIKSIFSRLKESDVDTAIFQANNILRDISNGIKDSSLLNIMDVGLASKGSTLFYSEQTLSKLKDTADSIIENKLKAIQIFQNRKKGKNFGVEEARKIEELEKDISKSNYIKGISDFLLDAKNMVDQAQTSILKLYDKDGSLKIDGNLSEQRKIARLLRDIKNFVASYKEPLSKLTELEMAAKIGEIDLSLDDAKKLTTSAIEINGVISQLDNKYKDISFALIHNMLKPLFGEDKVIPFGKNKDYIVKLDDLLKGAEKDINIINQLLDSAADSGDILIGLFDKVIKIAKNQVRINTEELTHEMRKIHNVLLNSGEKNTEFMFEIDETGTPSGYYVSDIDHNKYNRERSKKLKELTDQGLSEEQISNEMARWTSLNTTPVLVDDMDNRWERMPKKELYPSNKLKSLNAAQRKYYDEFMKIKSSLDTLVPESVVYKYKAVQDRNATIQAVMNADGLKNKANAYGSSLADRVLRRESEDEFGNPSKKNNKGETIVLKDFNGQEVKTLPIYYTNMLQDLSRLSLDATSSIIKYGQMAMNYHGMFQIIDSLELGRDIMKEREIQQYRGSRKLVEKINAFGKSLQKDYETKGDSNILRRYEDLLDMQVYGRTKLDEGTWDIFGKQVDKAKVADTLSSMTSMTVLGMNFFSGINNVAMGKFQLFLESMSGEYIKYKDTLIGDKNYFAQLPEFTAELGSNKITSKLGLINETYDVFQEWDRASKTHDFYKNPVLRVFGKGSVYFLQSAGEHYLQSRTMLAYMNAYKVKDSTGKILSLYDAYEVKKEIIDNKVVDAKLKLKEGVTKLDGSAFTEDDVRDITLKVAKINQGMNGIYNTSDKSAIQKYALGRLAIMFRKWMVPHYNRRFKGTFYDTQLDQWREGFYNSAGRFVISLIKELKQGQLNIGVTWNQLSNHERANIKRALTESASFVALSFAIFLMGSWKDKDTWASRVAQYELRRMQLEIGTSFYVPMMVTEGMTILQSPSAAIKTTNLIVDALNIFDLYNEVDRGRYKGHSKYYRNQMQNMPVLGNLRKIFDIQSDDAMFNIFKR